jgi:hypothetical protein
MGASDRPRSENHRPGDDRHLSVDVLNRYIDGDLDSAERGRADAHLSECADCRSELADVQMLASLLSDLPQVEVSRSFQLGPKYLRPPSLWDRLAALLLPMMPAMRATTVALVLVLGGLTAYRIFDDQPSSGPVSEFSAPTTSTSESGQFATTNTPAITETPMQSAAQKAPPPTDSASRNSGDNAAADESGAGAEAPAQSEPSDASNSAGSQPSNSTELQLPGQAQPAPTEATEESSANSASDTSIMVAAEAASPTASPTATATASPSPSPTASPTATPSATATPAPTPTIAPVATGSSDRDWLGWAQAVLAAGILILSGLMLGLSRFRKPI